MSFIRKLIFIFLLAVVAIVVLFFSQRNSAEVRIDFYFAQIDSISVWFLTFVSLLVGSLFTVIVFFFDILRVNVNMRRLRKENKRLKKEIESIKSGGSSTEVSTGSELPQIADSSSEDSSLEGELVSEDDEESGDAG